MGGTATLLAWCTCAPATSCLIQLRVFPIWCGAGRGKPIDNKLPGWPERKDQWWVVVFNGKIK